MGRRRAGRTRRSEGAALGRGMPGWDRITNSVSADATKGVKRLLELPTRPRSSGAHLIRSCCAPWLRHPRHPGSPRNSLQRIVL